MKLPPEISALFERYGPVHVQEITHLMDQFQQTSKGVRYGAGVILTTPANEYVLLRLNYDLPGIKRSDWNLPGGKVEAGESFEEAAIREAREETGCIVQLTGLYKVFHFHHLFGEESVGEWCMIIFRGRTNTVLVDHISREVAEIKLFKELPDNFAGDLKRYYRDLY